MGSTADILDLVAGTLKEEIKVRYCPLWRVIARCPPRRPEEGLMWLLELWRTSWRTMRAKLNKMEGRWRG